MAKTNYMIEDQTDDYIIIRDVGPWHHFMTVTNAAEEVVAEMNELLRGRKLYYYDSDNQLDEIMIHDGVFAGFAPGPKNIK